MTLLGKVLKLSQRGSKGLSTCHTNQVLHLLGIPDRCLDLSTPQPGGLIPALMGQEVLPTSDLFVRVHINDQQQPVVFWVANLNHNNASPSQHLTVLRLFHTKMRRSSRSISKLKSLCKRKTINRVTSTLTSFWYRRHYAGNLTEFVYLMSMITRSFRNVIL